MRYLVTGAAGFIGSQVARLLLQSGERVVGVDNLNEAYDPRLKNWRLDQLRGFANFSFYRLDICDQKALGGLFEKEGPFDAVLNLAARAGVRASVEDPQGYFETNVTGTLNLLELCRRYGIRKFVLASTSSLYGAHNPRPFREDADTSYPLSPYAASKKAAEALCYTYHYLHGIDVTVLRYFTVYGPAGRPDMSIFRFIRWIAEGEPLVVFGDGSQQRDFTYIDDIARGTLSALKPVGYQIINLGSDRPVSITELINLLEGLLSKKARVVHQPPHAADVPATWADITKARELLGWEPQTGLEEGLKRTVMWYFDNRGWAREIKLP
ncbi:MAG: nucleotide sugar epimerase [Deltaproteobacteria bacterium]|nr:MAG: nucleotide sugar epimerase [Deltaproteobacteria bacterium]